MKRSQLVNEIVQMTKQIGWCTKPSDFAPVPTMSMIIDGVITCPLAHLFRAHANGIDMRPPSLGILQVTGCRPPKEVERIIDNAFWTMIIDMKFRQHELRAAQAIH